MRRLIAASILFAVSLSAAAAPSETLRFYGYAYDLKSNAYLYTEVHEQKAVGERWTGGVITYYWPDGSRMGRKTLDFGKDEFVPLFKLDQDYGYSEGISAAGESLELFRQKSRTDKVERESVGRKDNMAADSGFHSFLRAHFPQLMQGEIVPLVLAVPGDLDTYKFRGRKVADVQFEGKPAVQIRVEADSALVRMVAPSLELVYEPRERKLLEYRGPSNIHNPKTGDIYNVRIAYYSTPPADAPKLPPLQ